MAIRMRRGLKDAFDKTKMLPGEWAVSIDSDTNKQVVWMCFASGVVKRMGTYEDLDADVQSMIAPYILQMQAAVTASATSETNSKASETAASGSASAAALSASGANASKNTSVASATTSTSYAVGGTGSRTGEDTDNAKYYKEQAQAAVAGLTNAYIYMGTVTFASIPTANLKQGYTYNVSDDFTTDSRFKEGSGNTYTAGTNISYTSDGYWDVLGGKMNSYLRKDGDSLNNTVTFSEAAVDADIASSDTHATLFGKIKKRFNVLATLITAIKAITASDYSASITYAVGDYRIYNNVLYRCSTAITVAEAWNASHWTATTVITEMLSLIATVASHTASIAKIQKTGLSSYQFYSLNGISNGVINVQAVSGSGVCFLVDVRVKTIRVTSTGAGAVQYGIASFGSTLPTIVSSGAGRGTYGTVAAGGTADFSWAGSAGLFFVGSVGTATTLTVEVVDYV